MVLLVGTTGLAAADEGAVRMDQAWPAVPHHHDATMEQQIQDWITHMGGTLDQHLAMLSHDVVNLTIDGRGQRAHLEIHARSSSLSVGIENDVHVHDGVARFKTRV